MAETWKKLAFYDEVATTFIGLSDTPANYTDAGGKYVKVNAGADALEFGLAAGVASGLATLDASSVCAQAPKLHAAAHKLAGGDVVLLNELGLPTGAVDFNGQQAKDLALDNQAANPTPVLGKIYFKTGDLHPYVCTAIA
jgi:hypothetical protein